MVHTVHVIGSSEWQASYSVSMVNFLFSNTTTIMTSASSNPPIFYIEKIRNLLIWVKVLLKNFQSLGQNSFSSIHHLLETKWWWRSSDLQAAELRWDGWAKNHPLWSRSSKLQGHLPDFIHSHHYRVTQGTGMNFTSVKLAITDLRDLHSLGGRYVNVEKGELQKWQVWGKESRGSGKPPF